MGFLGIVRRPWSCVLVTGKEQGRKRKKGVGNANSSADVDRGRQAFYKVVSYCVGEQCRRAMLLIHFGERLSVPCSGCDWCLDRKNVSQQVRYSLPRHCCSAL